MWVQALNQALCKNGKYLKHWDTSPTHFGVFEIRSYCMSLAGLGLETIVHPLPKCWVAGLHYTAYSLGSLGFGF